MNQYRVMRSRHQSEINSLNLFWAFSQEQFNEAIAKLGLDPNNKQDMSRLRRIPGGGFALEEEAKRMVYVVREHQKEMDKAIADDKTGDGFIYDMFVYELFNHEYGYTGDSEDTLDSLGLSYEEVHANKALEHGFKKACAYVMANSEC